MRASGEHTPQGRQGFLGSDRRFYTRSEAFAIAEAAGQIKHGAHSPGVLFTEDLW